MTKLRQSHLDARLSDLLSRDVAVTEHRRAHRIGRVTRIDADPELSASIVARLDRLTCHQIGAYFPPARHIHPATSIAGRSVIAHLQRSAIFFDKRVTSVAHRRSSPVTGR